LAVSDYQINDPGKPAGTRTENVVIHDPDKPPAEGFAEVLVGMGRERGLPPLQPPTSMRLAGNSQMYVMLILHGDAVGDPGLAAQWQAWFDAACASAPGGATSQQ
jgi:hypothetical protein